MSTTPSHSGSDVERGGDQMRAMHQAPVKAGQAARDLLASIMEPQFPVEAEMARKGLHFMLPSSWAAEAIDAALSQPAPHGEVSKPVAAMIHSSMSKDFDRCDTLVPRGEVNQADRDAAKAFLANWPRVSVPDYIEPALAEAFRNHRLASQPTEVGEIVRWLRVQTDQGTDAAMKAVINSDSERNFIAGAVALKRAADAIERGDYRTPTTSGENGNV